MSKIPIQAGQGAERGQAILEFAMIMPMLFLMLVGVAYFAMGFNLQQVLNGAVAEGARVWARNPAGGNTTACSLPKCNSDNGGEIENNFEKYIKPIVRNYVSSHGFDGNKVIFYVAKNSKPDNTGDLVEDSVSSFKVADNVSRDPELVTLAIIYPYNLPIGNFAKDYLTVKVSATCRMKKG
jgi:uncharacterized protein (UPF0333 family)